MPKHTHNDLRTNKHNKAIHTLAKTLLGHPTTYCFRIINTWSHKERTPDITTPSWLMPCTCCYLPRWQCLARLRLDILCILCTPPTSKPPFTPNRNLTTQVFTHCNDIFPHETTTSKYQKHAILQPLSTTQGYKSNPQPPNHNHTHESML